MRYFILLEVILISIIVFSACSKQQAQEIDAYDFPVKPGTEQWAKFTSYNEMLEACQVPEYILKNMSTEGLVITVINYPLVFNYYAYNTQQRGIETMTANFNGLSELMIREDSCTELFKIYKEISDEDSEELTDIQKGNNKLILSYIEGIMSQDEIINKFSEDEIYKLIKETNNRYEKQNSTSKLWLMCRALESVKYEPFIKAVEDNKLLYDFLENGFVVDDNTSKIILENVENYLADRK